MRVIFLLVGSLLPLISTVIYVLSIVRGQTRPQRMTRLLLLVISMLSFGALLAGHDTSGVWLALVSLMQAVPLWVLSLKWGMGGSSRLDFICLGLCAVGLLLWIVSGRSFLGLSMSLVADTAACLPALYQVARLPHTDVAWFYALDVVAGICIALAGPYTVEAFLFPLYIATINAVFVVTLCWPRRSAAVIPTDTADYKE